MNPSAPGRHSEAGASVWAGNRSEPARTPDVSLVGLLTVLLRHRRALVLVPVVLFTAIAAWTLSRPRSYTAMAAFMPQASANRLSRLAGFASQFGLPVGDMQTTQSPDFYADLLTSHQLLGAVVDTRFTYPVDGGERSGNLVEIYRASGRTPAERREAAIRSLKNQVAVNVQMKTGMVRVAVKARSPILGRDIAGRMLELLNEFNLKTRQSQASEERRFVESRLGDVKAELRQAEDELQTFLQRNRDFANSPELSFRRERLLREVMLRQGVFSTLAQANEQARIDEVRSTPVITVVERPEEPVRPDSRQLVLKGLLALLVGGLLALIYALIRDGFVLPHELGSAEYERLIAAREEAVEDIRRPLRGLGGAFQRGPRSGT